VLWTSIFEGRSAGLDLNWPDVTSFSTARYLTSLGNRISTYNLGLSTAEI
jgi:hypothetical protein